jgi:hypothetical protein
MSYRISFLLLSSLFLVSAWWHPYDFQKKYPEYCKRSNTSSRLDYDGSVPTQEQMDRWGLWPGVISSFTRKHGESMVGFKEGMEYIWNHQHPADCSKVQFLIEGGYEEGFGSETHLIGAGLAVAINLNRVYLMNIDREGVNHIKLENRYGFEINTTFCRNQSKLSLECYYLPWSSCTIEDALRNYKPFNEIEEIDPEAYHYNPTDPQHNYLTERYTNQKTLRIRLTSAFGTDAYLPQVLHQIWECSPFHHSKYRYWWRAMSTAYILRPNPATVALIQKYESRYIPFNIEEERCIAVYIRRGDKHVEMNIQKDTSMFFDAASLLWSTYITYNNHFHAEHNPIMFLGSEEPSVIVEGKEWSNIHHWKLLETELFNRSEVSTYLDYQTQAKLWGEHHPVHNEYEYLSMIINLDMYIKCSGFVCTERSNFCRVIDELRATVGGKANAPLVEIDCPHDPPCINRNVEIDF